MTHVVVAIILYLFIEVFTNFAQVIFDQHTKWPIFVGHFLESISLNPFPSLYVKT